MKLVVISLERASKRRDRITKQLAALNLDAIIMDAVDGQTLTEEEKNKKIHLPNGYRFGEVFKPGEIACTMSHIKAIKIAKDNEWSDVIILEDDVILSDDFEKRIKYLFKILPSDWEHVYLSGIPRISRTHEPMLNILHVEPSGVVDCIPAVLIRETAYQKLIDYHSKFESTTDDNIIAMIFQYKTLKSYTYFPFSAYVDDDFTFIWNHELKREHKSKLYFKNNIL